MKLGASGPEVQALREALRGMGYELPAGSTYDAAAAEAVSTFQLAWGLAPTGEADPATLQKVALVSKAGLQETIVVRGDAPPHPLGMLAWAALLALLLHCAALVGDTADAAPAPLRGPGMALPLCEAGREGSVAVQVNRRTGATWTCACTYAGPEERRYYWRGEGGEAGSPDWCPAPARGRTP